MDKKKINKKKNNNEVRRSVELKYPKISLIDKNDLESDYFYRDLEMFRPDLDEE